MSLLPVLSKGKAICGRRTCTCWRACLFELLLVHHETNSTDVRAVCCPLSSTSFTGCCVLESFCFYLHANFPQVWVRSNRSSHLWSLDPVTLKRGILLQNNPLLKQFCLKTLQVTDPCGKARGFQVKLCGFGSLFMLLLYALSVLRFLSPVRG